MFSEASEDSAQAGLLPLGHAWRVLAWRGRHLDAIAGEGAHGVGLVPVDLILVAGGTAAHQGTRGVPTVPHPVLTSPDHLIAHPAVLA